MLINVIKGATGRKIGQKFPQYKQRDPVWTRAYFVATAGDVSAETVKKYIEPVEYPPGREDGLKLGTVKNLCPFQGGEKSIILSTNL